MSNRKLIRPTLADAAARTRETPSVRSLPGGMGRAKGLPPDETRAETFYYLKQMGTKTPMIVVLTDGEILRGWIEWYDKNCVKLNRERGPNLLLMKHSIKYMYKEEEERGSERRSRRIKERQQRDGKKGNLEKGRAAAAAASAAPTGTAADEEDDD